jgi:hypothetical protein
MSPCKEKVEERPTKGEAEARKRSGGGEDG